MSCPIIGQTYHLISLFVDLCLPMIHSRLPCLEQEWIRNLIKQSKTIYPTLLITILYLQRLRYMITDVEDPYKVDPRLTFVTALAIASDFLLDYSHRAMDWAEFTKFSHLTIILGRVEFMEELVFDFGVDIDQFFALDSQIRGIGGYCGSQETNS